MGAKLQRRDCEFLRSDSRCLRQKLSRVKILETIAAYNFRQFIHGSGGAPYASFLK
jgi:hypothetical protein